ncbi:nicotinate-nicotinamide nucleotide adenylyltransferase [Pseudorhodoferax sp. Leaf267]|nr:nicotinate (nicotinamide) nucleotide adenylyltransferase [Pseudorhodoferax sp. Leaf267]KQP23615.1 nicotinate-nicotinamide nucleotide adenylyltransferase [Pseudorhodoferax sp. Leaf267]
MNPAGVRRVGVYGGAFDPPHVTHVALAQAAVRQLQLDALHILPTGQAWHRAQQTSAAQHRLAMAQLAFAQVQGAVVDAREIERHGPSYTVDSLRELQTLYPRALLHLIIGADQARALEQWHAWQDIVAMAVLVIAARIDAAEPLEPEAPPGARYHYLQLAPVDTSATHIRQRVASGQGIAHLVPDAVARYIAQHHLYHTAR